MSLEAVFAAIFGALLLNEKLNSVQIIGSVIIMVSIFGVQILSIYQTRRALAEIKNE
jgi:drug/metabolite transporter (DMT)-like permease